jgi:LuxR family maltose regulon positive regulatory protein
MGMIGLIRQLPDEVILRGPNLAVYKAWFLLVSGRLQMASALLNHIERTYGNAAPGEDHRGLLSFVAMQQAYIAEITEGPTVRRVDPSRLVHVAESRGGMRNSAEVILAYVLYRNEEFAEAARLLQMTLDRDMRTGATNGIPIAGSRLARMWLVEGRLQEAAALCQSSLSVIEPRGKWRFYVAGNLSIVLGDVLREWDRLDEAEANIRTGLQDNAPWGIAHAYALGYTALARLLLSRRDASGAAAALAQQAELTAGRTILPDAASETRAAQMRIWLADGDTAQVARWAEAWSAGAEAPPNFRNEQDLLTLARAWLGLSKAREAAELLARMQAGTARDRRARRFAEILMLLAAAHQATGDGRRAVAAMAQSLAVAAPMGCIRLYLDEPPETLVLVATAGRQAGFPAIAAQFVSSVLAQRPGDRQPSSPPPPASPAAPLVEALTPREQEVLGLLNAGLSNQEIADRLVITLHAVKKHTGNIYGKLGVTSRTQAIVRARDLGLLPVH